MGPSLIALKRFSLGSVRRVKIGDVFTVNRDKAKCLMAFGLAGRVAEPRPTLEVAT